MTKRNPVLPRNCVVNAQGYGAKAIALTRGGLAETLGKLTTRAEEARLNCQKSAEAIVAGTDVMPTKGRTRSEGRGPTEGGWWQVRETYKDSRKPRKGPTLGKKR
ncbi:hypothetical protein D2962_12945 [Biomaibacter acetigenes]|uniref:Uncharacterized protein n=1 Tax=Biomaibacter acetigenes TaxID=2316383 RepID=A0A3G2R7K3_9FIRM|nr:hypothetical protein [Biomaibacter acetigenes]AYO29559.1 hypothetical protein D2962_02095 [Biomaibacter acetigenes]AYO31383.1 hypothetical protein D2962_12945 [Biomaibacter acetigenes]